jgi:SAM-dependent methyltransferase
MKTEAKFVHQSDVYNLNASTQVVPILIEMFQPKSVLDVGCGIGTWLKSFYDFGVTDVMGVDGDYVDREQLKQYISENLFKPADLTYPFNLQRKFDLVLSLEVAEHLPEPSALGFIETLCKHGDTIIFSAAIPHQGGQNHVNEQWKEYWINKFYSFGYQPYDLLRARIWNINLVDWWYKQNMLVFSQKDFTNLGVRNNQIIEFIHPDLYQHYVEDVIYLQQYVQELESKIYK